MIPLKLNSLLKHLKDKHYDVHDQPETNQIYVIFELHKQKFPLFLRIIEESGLLQMLVFMPFNLSQTAVSDTARFLHLLNKELDIPGFGMDEDARVIFYRIMIPAKNKEIETEIFESFVQSMKNVSESFFPVVAAVGQGAATFEEVLKKMKELP